MRSLVFTTDTTGGLCKASAMPRAKLEVLGIPEDYADAEALVIIDAVYGAGVLEAQARGGTAGG